MRRECQALSNLASNNQQLAKLHVGMIPMHAEGTSCPLLWTDYLIWPHYLICIAQVLLVCLVQAQVQAYSWLSHLLAKPQFRHLGVRTYHSLLTMHPSSK